MSRDGLVEKNLSTGEETRVSMRGEDFELKKSTESYSLEKTSSSPARGNTPQRAYQQKKMIQNHQRQIFSENEPQNPTVSENSACPYETTPRVDTERYRGEIPPKSPLNATEKETRLSTKERNHQAQKFSENSATKERLTTTPNPLQFETGTEIKDRKLSKLEDQLAHQEQKLEKAQNRLPTKKKLARVRMYDESQEKGQTKLVFEEKIEPRGIKKSSLPVRGGKQVLRTGTRTGANKIHQKISEVEEDNVGVKSAHKTEETIEHLHLGRKGRSVYRYTKDRPYRQVDKWQKKTAKSHFKLEQEKMVRENPQLSSNPISRRLQKRKIKKDYAKASREAGKATRKFTEKVKDTFRAAYLAVRNHPHIALAIGAIALIFLLLISSLSSCSTVVLGTIGGSFGSSYLADDSDIDSAELVYTEWETDLQLKIKNAESENPGFDEYRYNVGEIGHDPYELMAFLTSKYEYFSFEQIKPILEELFSEQYQLSFVEETEIRTRTILKTDPDTGETYEEIEEYEWYILNINLVSKSLTDLLVTRLNGNEFDHYSVLMATKGMRQYALSPFDFNWIPYISSPYGWRLDPKTGAKSNHKAVDIAVPYGTPILATHDGTVTTATTHSSYGNYIAIDDGKGLVTKYAHCSELLVTVGQQVHEGDVIAKVGSTGNSTGNHLHFEVIFKGEYLNPLYFSVTNDDGNATIPPGAPGGAEYPSYPGEPITNDAFAAMIAEAEKHLGKKYVFGASGPNNFDCSGYVSWVLDKSGVRPMSRTGAQGLYNMSTPVSPENAKPGDLVFFTKTYSSSNPVSHVGIYVGNGKMIHCGDPIQYADINTRYWQEHFYAFGRVT